jgi:hypothetical protein
VAFHSESSGSYIFSSNDFIVLLFIAKCRTRDFKMLTGKTLVC